MEGKRVRGAPFPTRLKNSSLNITTSFSEHLINLKSKHNSLDAYYLKTTIVGTKEESKGNI